MEAQEKYLTIRNYFEKISKSLLTEDELYQKFLYPESKETVHKISKRITKTYTNYKEEILTKIKEIMGKTNEEILDTVYIKEEGNRE